MQLPRSPSPQTPILSWGSTQVVLGQGELPSTFRSATRWSWSNCKYLGNESDGERPGWWGFFLNQREQKIPEGISHITVTFHKALVSALMHVLSPDMK